MRKLAFTAFMLEMVLIHGAGRVVAQSAATGRAAADPLETRIPRVRTSDPIIATLIQSATLKSPTFRRLIDTIETTDGIVYVEPGDCGHQVRSCVAMSLTMAGAYRVLRVVVDRRRVDLDLTASVGHELQHAVEILSNRSLTASIDLYFFYRREGTHQPDSGSTGAFETEAAIQTELDVRAEVKAYERLVRGR